jgi:hypothetical protein
MKPSKNSINVPRKIVMTSEMNLVYSVSVIDYEI